MKTKKIVALTIILTVIFTITTLGAVQHSIKFYKKYVKKHKIGVVRQYDSEKLTDAILDNRGDDIIIERVFGIVTDNKGNGKLLKGDGYISYKSVKGRRKGDVVMTLLIYAPNKGKDSIADRFDYIIDRQ